MIGTTLFLAACQSGDRVTRSSESVLWRGSTVWGADVDRAVETVLEPAWLRVAQDWEPVGWSILIEPAAFVCPRGALAGDPPQRLPDEATCRGITDTRRRLIRTIPDVAVAAWELGNARCWERTGEVRDRGGAC